MKLLTQSVSSTHWKKLPKCIHNLYTKEVNALLLTFLVQMKKDNSMTKKSKRNVQALLKRSGNTTRTKRSINKKRNIGISMINQSTKSVSLKMFANQIQFGLKRQILPLRKLLDFTENLT